MNGPCLPREHRERDHPVLRARAEPVPAKPGKRPPLEARTNWDPWLPVTNAASDVSGPLHAIALAIIAVGALFLVAMTMMMLASL